MHTIMISSLLSLLLPFCLSAEAYWQQEVEYDMTIRLDDQAKTINAHSNLRYINRSPDDLDKIYMHLLPNALNVGTIAAKVWDLGGYGLDPDKPWTGITIQQVKRDSLTLSFSIHDDTLLEILLDRPLASGDTLDFTLAWHSIIHEHLDRSGWKGNQFDLAQWYPKFVVYDEQGWHDDPFGDWGEYFGEFGTFRVRLDLPAAHVVAATGIVESGDPGWSEVKVDTTRLWADWVSQFQEQRAEVLSGLDTSARRVVTFLAENVHDFAWSSSPDYVYEHGSWNDIDVHVLYDVKYGEDWTRDVVRWGKRSLAWLSGKFGAYHWPQITLIKALLDGGMEYPMLVMEGSDSESLAAHEIGHNWFYGMLANDELDEAWLDEGFTTFQTRWYKQHHYPGNDYSHSRGYVTDFEHKNLQLQDYMEAGLKPAIRYMLSPANQPIALRSFEFSDYAGYRDNVYEKASVMMDMLKNYLGEPRFLAGMQLYHQRWALKHVNEERFIQAMEEASGENLDWFFDQWLHGTDHVDYALKSWESKKQTDGSFLTTIDVINKGGMFVPLTATVYSGSGEQARGSLKEFRFRDKGQILVHTSFRPTRVYLDAENTFFDVDRRNNDSKWKWAWRYDYKGWDAYPGDRNLFLWKPQFSFNDLNGPGLGLSIKQVYRNTGNFIRLEVDQSVDASQADVGLSFSHLQVGLPFQGTWKGSVRSWLSMQAAQLEYEIHWAKRLWINPLHYLSFQIEFTDARHAFVPASSQYAFMRFGLKYDYQNKLLGGNYGFTTKLMLSPASMGTYGQGFEQIQMISNWSRRFDGFRVDNRTNLMLNAKGTPELVMTRIASADLRTLYLDRLTLSMVEVFENYSEGYHYNLPGGGRFRGYTDTLDVPVKLLWSNNLDITLRNIPYLPPALKPGLFLDIGQTSAEAADWTALADAGLTFRYSPTWKRNSWISTLIRPFHMNLALPIFRLEEDQWVSMHRSLPWIFTISTR